MTQSNATNEQVQAIVFAGGHGNRMTNLTEQMEKPLLPVANIPLFWYSLNILSRNSITEVLLVTNDRCCKSIRTALNDGSLPPLSSLNIEIISLNSSVDEDVDQWGTADVLRHLHKKIKPNHDLLIVSGDIVSDISLARMFEFHRQNSSFLTCLFWDSPLNGPIPGTKTHKKYRDFTALVPETEQLLFLIEEDDFDTEEEFDSKLFEKYPKVLLTSKYKDCHLYILDGRALNVLADDDERYTSIKADLIPYLLEYQYRGRGRISKHLSCDSIQCFAYRATAQDCSLLAQCNTVSAFFEANRAVQRILKSIAPTMVEKQRNVQDLKAQKVNVSESIISNVEVNIGEKTAVKKSVIGPNCKLGSNVKVENSLLVSGVCLNNGAVIKSSIIFPNSVVSEKAEVNMCVVGCDQTVATKEKVANTILRMEKEMYLDA